MVRAVIVGNGAREHVIAEALVKSGVELMAFMKTRNPGIAALCNEHIKISPLNDFVELESFAKGVDFVVVGPESPLVVGIANALKSAGIACVGPLIQAAQLEGSKIFTRNLLKKYELKSNVIFKDFYSMDGTEDWLKKLGLENIVVKPDGLTGGKGVKVAGEHLNSLDEVLNYCEEILRRGSFYLIEEKLNGEEFTLQTFVDGKKVIPTPLVQDHKRAYDDDKGPNTGGMGSYSMENHLLPFISQQDVDFALSEMKKTIDALKEETGTEYKGFLYGQFMKTKKGIKLVEYNARLGDPEAMNVLAILEDNFADICLGIINGNLKNRYKFKKAATVCKYLAPEGYPVNPRKDLPINVNSTKLEELGVEYYYASVNEKNDVIYTSSSRTIGLLGIGSSLEEAENMAEKATQYVKGQLFHRKDIGTPKLLQKKIEHMKMVMK
ncbi:MAG: phosphoribosylamine--glycine ligase [Promethearchaeota archaeon]